MNARPARSHSSSAQRAVTITKDVLLQNGNQFDLTAVHGATAGPVRSWCDDLVELDNERKVSDKNEKFFAKEERTGANLYTRLAAGNKNAQCCDVRAVVEINFALRRTVVFSTCCYGIKLEML